MKLLFLHGISLRLFVLLTVLMIFVFVVIVFININYYNQHIEENIRDQAIQASNLIKRSIRNSMLKNQREDLALTLSDIGKDHYIQNVRIFKKIGEIAFSTDSTELHQLFDIENDLCHVCHKEHQSKGTIPGENQFREIRADRNDKVIGLLNPIENEPDCFNASCHAHDKHETLLGYLDMRISFQDLQVSTMQTRNTTLLFSVCLIFLATLGIARIIQEQVQTPVTKLMAGTRQVSILNLDHAIDIDSRDEYGDLARSFNQMTTKLKESNAKLKDWSYTLEKTVEEKTKELEEANQQLLLSEKMASMGRLSAMVAHEINNPMSGILTYSQLLIKELQNQPDENKIKAAIENLGIIRDESKRCGEIVKNLLFFSRQSSGVKSNTDLRSIIKKSINLISHGFEMNRITLTTNIPENEALVYCDPDALEQMLIAMLVNATEAVPKKGGQIFVSLILHRDKNKYDLVISDNGVGIAEKDLSHIFDPFYSTKDSGSNTGLGLAIAYGIIEKHQGSIKVDSLENRGTTITISLPINENQGTLNAE